MNIFEVETQGTNTFLVYKVNNNDNLDTMSLGMLTNNTIEGFAQTLPLHSNEDFYIKYNISSKISLEQFFSAAVNKARLMTVLESLLKAIETAEDYMIDTNHIVLDLRHIYVDVSSCKVELICLPVINEEKTENNFNSFFKTIMYNTQFDSSENCDHVAEILNYLNCNTVINPSDFRKKIIELQNNRTDRPVVKETVNTRTVKPKLQQVEPVTPVNIVPPVQKPVEKTKTAPKVETSREDVSFIIPENNPMPEKTNVLVEENEESDEEKELSFFHLLAHYSKDNAK